MEIILSTKNKSKADQIKALFDNPDVVIFTLSEAGIVGDVVEDGKTLEENALKKARFAWKQTKKWSIADDTGLFIDALNGEPGIYAARWAGENAKTEEIMNFTLKKIEGVQKNKRTGTFKTVAAVISPEGQENVFTGSIRGSFLIRPKVKCQPNMPYSAIFVPDGYSKSWAEMSVEEENSISHRGKAFRQVRDFFMDKIKINDK